MIRLWDYFFTRHESNSKRQVEVDIVRGLAVFFMILVHVSGEFLNESANDTLFSKVIDFMGCVPAAPVFMFIMGVGIVYSKKQTPFILLKRGALILLSGYILNFSRGLLPFFIGSKLGFYPFDSASTPWYTYLIVVDILQFAGFAMIFMSALKAIKLKEVYYPILAVAIGIASPYVWGIKTGNLVADAFISIIFGGNNTTYHPFFSWIFYPLMGAFFGWLLIRVKNKNKFYLASMVVSIPITFIGLAYYYLHSGMDLGIVTGNVYNYFHHGIISNIIFCSSVIWWIAIWHFASGFIPKFIKNRITFWSKSVTEIYFIHWIIIGWCEFLIFDTFSIPYTIIAMVVLIFITDRITDLYLKIKDRINDRSDLNITTAPNYREV